jgi:hypothetical protein
MIIRCSDGRIAGGGTKGASIVSSTKYRHQPPLTNKTKDLEGLILGTGRKGGRNVCSVLLSYGVFWCIK